MNVVILGDGPDELAWARHIDARAQDRLAAAYPGLPEFAGLPGAGDLEQALAVAEIDAAIVGGSREFRPEALRRVCAAGWPAIVLHPPGENADPYYQVALSGFETGAVVVPDLPGRLHPGVAALVDALQRGELGEFRALNYEVRLGRDREAPDLVLESFASAVDVARAILGEIAALTAVGDPPGERPSRSLTVQLRSADGRAAEVRCSAGHAEASARLALSGATGALALEHDPDWAGPARLVRDLPGRDEVVAAWEDWDRREAILGVLERARGRQPAHPDLLDGTRAMELAEAARRSLRKGRTIDLEYEAISEVGNFKSVMTGLGCGLLLGVLVVLPLALAGPVFGAPWTIYLAWLIPPVLVLFAVMQLLRFGMREPAPPASGGADRP